jgi:hypothetical protein
MASAFPLSVRASRAARPAAGSPADARGEIVVSMDLPEVER